MAEYFCTVPYDLSYSCLSAVGEPINTEAWEWYHRVVGDGRCPVVDTWWQTGNRTHRSDRFIHRILQHYTTFYSSTNSAGYFRNLNIRLLERVKLQNSVFYFILFFNAAVCIKQPKRLRLVKIPVSQLDPGVPSYLQLITGNY